MKKVWQKKEMKDAKDMGGKVTPRSGGFWSNPGDVKTDEFLIDSKTSIHDRFSIPVKMWKKVRKEALTSQRMPLLSLEYGKTERVEVVVLDRNDFITLLDKSRGGK